MAEILLAVGITLMIVGAIAECALSSAKSQAAWDRHELERKIKQLEEDR